MKIKKTTIIIKYLVIGICAVFLFWVVNIFSEGEKRQKLDNQIPIVFNKSSSQDISILLGRPTERSITLSILPQINAELSIAYGTESEKYDKEKNNILAKANIPIEIELDDLQGDIKYYYKIQYKEEDKEEWQSTQEHTFHTARSKGSSFTFTIEADPHLDEQSDPEIYRQTLNNILFDHPDFLIDLGDTFMSDKLVVKSYETIEERHIMLRQYFGIVGADIPLFLVLGNHEGESGWELKNGENNIAVWATNIRKQYYPNPVPNGFYSGNSIEEEYVGLREDYYAFEWGDVLNVILDPYWYTEAKPNKDGWEWTLGKEQYDWLKETLENSSAKYKFVFIHHLVGGGKDARGGIEFADLYEWGGNNLDGSYGFDTNRPGWGKPIHQLLVDNNINIVFKGHDHFYAKQELDGVVYQTLPQPSHPGEKVNTAEEYGYLSGKILGGSGYLHVEVLNNYVTIQFVKNDGSIIYSYSI